MRIHIPKEHYEPFKKWFLSNKDRENSVYRETKEEMVDEENFLASLLPSDITEKYVTTVETTQDWEVDGKMKTSYYFFEIYDVNFSKNIEDEILKKLVNDDKLKLFTSIQIKSDSNIIAGSSKYIL